MSTERGRVPRGQSQGSLDKLELPLANWDVIPRKHPALSAALAGEPMAFHGLGGGQGGASTDFPAKTRSGQGDREVASVLRLGPRPGWTAAHPKVR